MSNPQEFPVAVDVDKPEPAPAPDVVEQAVREPKRPADTYIMVEGNLMPASAQPPQGELQGAFRAGPKSTIVIDMDAALPIAQDMVRHARTAAFAKNDAATMQAMQRGDNDAMAAAREQGDKLRAATADKRLTDAKTPDALLKAVEAITAEF